MGRFSLSLAVIPVLLLAACGEHRDRESKPSLQFLANTSESGGISNTDEAGGPQPRWKSYDRQALHFSDTRDTGSSIHSSDMSDRGYDTITGRYNP